MNQMNLPPDVFHSALDEWWNLVQAWPAERARLRRCQEVDQAAFGPAFQGLVNRAAPAGRGNRERLLAIAILGAIVKKNDTTKSVAEQMAYSKTTGRPVLTDLRFRRLMRADSPEEAFPLLRRAIHMMDGTVNLHDLATSMYWWNDDTKKRWAFDYYALLPSEHLKKTS